MHPGIGRGGKRAKLYGAFTPTATGKPKHRRRSTLSANEKTEEKRIGAVFLMLGYVSVAGLAFNLVVRAGWLPIRVPGLTGSGARWGWLLAAAVSFAVAWYLERMSLQQRRTRH